MKFAYFGYDLFASCLETLLAAGHEWLALHTCPCDNTHAFNDRVLRRAEQHGVPVFFSPPTPASLEALAAQGCELVIAAGYPYKIPYSPDGGIAYGVNIHPSLLPVGRGAWPFPRIILDGHSASGVTLHKLEPAWDAGDILVQEAFPLHANERLESLIARSQLLAPRLLQRFLDAPEILWGTARSLDIAGFPVEKAPDVARSTIDWRQGVAAIDRHIRAYGGFYSYAIIENVKYLITDAVCWPEAHAHEPGTLVHTTARERVVAAADGFVLLRNLSVLSEKVAIL